MTSSDQTVCSPGGAFTSPVYGPVESWRHGRSLGIDLILRDSICSFSCIYCQLGKIHQVTDAQDVFVPTERVIDELMKIDPADVDIITFSGSGEPTLALNIDEVIHFAKATFGKPVLVLTNATMLYDEATRGRLAHADIVECKLDAATAETLAKFNRPAPGVTVERIVEGIRALRDDKRFLGKVALQCMFMPLNMHEAEAIGDLIATIQPDEVFLNTPRRAVPKEWYPEARGDHGRTAPVEKSELRTLTEDEARDVQRVLEDRGGAPVVSVFDRGRGT